MAFIVDQFIGDRAIQLGNEELIRPMSFGTNWARLRVGITCAYSGGQTTLAAGNSQGGLFGPLLGVCTGSTGRLSLVATDVIWTSWWSGGQNLTYSGTTPNFYFDPSGTTAIAAWQRVGSTTANGTGFTNVRACVSANQNALRTFFAFDITKGSAGVGTYSLTMYSQINTQITTDFTRAAFIAAMTNDGTPTNTTGLGTALGYCGLRSVKDWNSVYIAHSRSQPALTVYNMAVARYT